MSSGAPPGKIDLKGCTRTFLFFIGLVFLTACSHHQPAPVEEQSNATSKRQLNKDGSYTIKSGDTLYAIAFNFDVDARNIADWNAIASPYIIYPGQKLQLKAPTSGGRNRSVSSSAKTTPLKSPKSTTAKAGSSAKKTATTPAKTAGGSTAKATPSTAKTTTDPKSWQWPTKGRVLRGYVAGNPARNGLDIAGKEGQDIKASSAGQVVYSGNGLIGYGELIIIKHSENMLSAYAHNKVRLVKEGENVKSGQKIARMGRNTGDEQLLHFEIRVRGKPVNPLTYLPEK